MKRKAILKRVPREKTFRLPHGEMKGTVRVLCQIKLVWMIMAINLQYWPVVLYGCETWSLTLREESRLRVFENRILRQIFEPKRDENGEWRRLHNEEFHSLYRLPNIVRVNKSRRLRWAGHVARMEEDSSAFKIYRNETFRKA